MEASAKQIWHGARSHEGIHHLLCDTCSCSFVPCHDVLQLLRAGQHESEAQLSLWQSQPASSASAPSRTDRAHADTHANCLQLWAACGYLSLQTLLQHAGTP